MTPERSLEIMTQMYASISGEMTPDLVDFVSKQRVMTEYMDLVVMKIDERVKEEDELLLQEACDTYVKAWRRAAEVHAARYFEDFKERQLPLDELDLRFLCHIPVRLTMTAPGLPVYHLFGKFPDPVPGPDVQWGTARDWLDVMNHSRLLAAVQQFKVLSLNRLCRFSIPVGSATTHIDFTNMLNDRPKIWEEKNPENQLSLIKKEEPETRRKKKRKVDALTAMLFDEGQES